MKFISEITDADVLATDPVKYALIADEVAAAPIEKCIEKAKKSMAKLKDRQKEPPARIDEASKSLVDVPELADLELHRNALNEQLAEVQKQKDDTEAAYKVVADLQAEIMQTKLDMGGVEQKANADLDKQRREARRTHSELESKAFDLFERRQRKEGEVKRLQALVESKEKERAELAEKWKSTKAMVMDESETVCKLCGQELPTDRIKLIRAVFERNKATTLDTITRDGQEVKSEIDDAAAKIQTLQTEIESLKQEWSEATAEKNKAYEAMNVLPAGIDLSTNQEYQALQDKLSNLEMRLGNMDTGASIKQQLSIQEKGIREELDGVNRQFATVEANERAQERIEELRTEQRTVGQQVADQEKKIFLLEEFSRAKMNMLSDKINQQFRLVRFRLFDKQLNGGIKDTCVMQIPVSPGDIVQIDTTKKGVVVDEPVDMEWVKTYGAENIREIVGLAES